MKPAKGQFNDLAATREKAMEHRTMAYADMSIQALDRSNAKNREIGIPISGDALGRIRQAREASLVSKRSKGKNAKKQ